MSNKHEDVVIEATLYWPFLGKVNDMSGKYQVDLGQLDKNAIKAIQSLGLTVRTDQPKDEDKPDREQFITAKSNYPFKVLFKNGVSVVPVDKIGNGTKARIKVNSYDWQFKGKSGSSLSAKVIQVTDLVEYTGVVDPDFEDSTPAPGQSHQTDELNDDLSDLYSDD
jgi:hypothetical protein